MFIFPFSLTFAVNGKDTFTRCNKYSRPALALGLSKKLDISRSFIRIFMVNHEDTFTRCNKYSSKLDISRSFIRIFAVIKDLVCSIILYNEILGHGCPHSILLRDCPMSLSSHSRW